MNFPKKNNLFIVIMGVFSLCLLTFIFINVSDYLDKNKQSKPIWGKIDTVILEKYKAFSWWVIESNIISFNQEMDRGSVEENTVLFPNIELEYIWEDNNKTLKLIPKKDIKEDIDFLVNISENALDAKWDKLNKKIVQKFRVDWIAQIDFITPEWEITDLTKNITVRFSKPIVSLTTLDNQPDCPIVITPEIPGKCIWITTSTFQFRPEQGFPIGAKYSVSIPKWIDTIAWGKTVNSKEIEIITPKFKKLNSESRWVADKPMIITFNAPISLENFKENFEIKEIPHTELDIGYLKVDSTIEWEQVEKKNIISIMPKSNDWGYWNNYNYTLKWWLKSIRWNVPIWNMSSSNYLIQKLLTNYSAFVYKDESLENKELYTNIKNSFNAKIINITKPKIILHFYEEIKLNKWLFSAVDENWRSVSFITKYAKKVEQVWSEKIILDDKYKIIIEFNSKKSKYIDLKIYTSRISSSVDENLRFSTKNLNEVLDYKFINYKKSCLVLKNDIWNWYEINDKFNFNWKDGTVNYLNLIRERSRDEDCKYKLWKFTYKVQSQLNPITDYNLTIKKGLLDRDNYPLVTDYNIKFQTKEALNEDKRVSIVDNREFILIPTDVKPLWVAINSVNLDKVLVKVCEWNFEVTNINYIKDEICETKNVSINNLWFTTNFSVLNLEEIFWRDFSKSLVTLKVEKLKQDKTKYELEREWDTRYSRSINYLRTNTSVVLKSNKNTLLWLSDFKTWELLNNQITNIDSYENKTEYSLFWKYLWNKKEFRNNIKFQAKEDWLYNLSGKLGSYLLITLKSWEQILFNSNNYYYSTPWVKSYLTTDRPIYKPWNTVKIKWVLRIETARDYQPTTSQYNFSVRDSNYKNIVDEKISLSNEGTFEYVLELDDDASLWNYNINIWNNSISFAVEEFEKPDFKVDTESAKENYYYWEIPEVSVLGEYYIWNSLSNWNWFYNINATDYNFNGWITIWYNWGENTNFWRYWENNNSQDNISVEYNKEFILDSEWKTNIEVDTSKTTGDMVYNISTTVTDPNTKKSIASNTSFKLLNSDTFVWLKQDKYYYEYWDTVKFNFVTVDIEGNKVRNKKLKFKVYKIDYNYDKETLTTNKEETLLTERTLITGLDGWTETFYKINDYWEFRFEIELDNKKYKTTKTTYVSWFNLIRPTEQEHDLSLIKDKEKYDIWDIAELVIQSPVTWIKALVTVEKLDEILFEEVIDISSNSQIYKLPIKKEYLPNLELKVFLIKTSNSTPIVIEELKKLRLAMIELEQKLYWQKEDNIIPLYVSYDIMYKWGFIPPFPKKVNLDTELLTNLAELKAKEQKLMQDIIPNYLVWNIPVKINLDSIELKSEATTDKQEYLPSDTSTIELNILDNDWNPINWEAIISVVDEALLALKNNDNDIVDFFYSDKYNNVRTMFNMQDLIKRFEFNELEHEFEEKLHESDKLKGNWLLRSMNKSVMMEDSMDMAMDSESTAGMAMPSSAPASNNATKLRTEFKDSAYYNWVVKVINWKAKVTIPKLPDNLTTWVVKWFTVTKDTKVWNFESKFQVKKTLNLLPSIPRFFVSGDEMEISAVVINNSDKSIKIEPSIEITNVEILKKPRKITIPANGQELIVWKVKVDAMKNDIDWKSYFSDITLKVVSWKLQDSLKVSKKIIPYSTPEYTFTNGSTYGLSYEEKINLPNYVDKTQWQIDISYWATILTSLLDNVENLAAMPFDNFYTTVSALKKWAILKWLYEKAWRLEDFKQITVIDYNWVSHKLVDIIDMRIDDLKNYQYRDWWMMTYDDCIPNWWRRTCSNFWLTWDFLNMAKLLKNNWYVFDAWIAEKALKYYEKELEKRIKESENNWWKYRNINPFFEIIWYDPEFIKKYLLTDRYTDSKDYTFDNISKLKIILLLQEVDKENKLIWDYLQELKNKTIIEARWTLLPANNYRWNNIVSTSLALRVFINSKESEKLIIENFARWLLAQKRENWEFGSSYDSSEVLKAITEYITYTKELDNVDFEAKWYLNYKEVTSEIFSDKNKFTLKQESFNLKDYIKFGVDNSLGFEKIGDWKLYYDVWLRYFLPIEKIDARDEWLIVTRNYYDYLEYNEAFKEECINPYWYWYSYRSYDSYNYCSKVKVKNIDSVLEWNKWDMLVWEIEIIVPSERNNVIINNFIPAGAEILNTNLDTTSSEVKNISWNTNNNWYSWFSHTEIKNDRVLLFAEHLYKWSYKYTYVIKLNHKWKYHNRPAVAEELKKPEIWGRSKWEFFTIK